MITLPVRLARGVMWLLLLVLVTAAISISALRFFLPRLNQYQEPIRQLVAEQTHLQLALTNVEGRWRNLGPSLRLEGVQVAAQQESAAMVELGSVEVQLDVLQSVLQQQWVLRDLQIERLALDLTQLPSSEKPSETKPEKDPSATYAQLESLLFEKLGAFSVRDSSIRFITPSGEPQQINIEDLKWDSQTQQHRIAGVISVADTELSRVEVIANLNDARKLSELAGRVYLKTEKLPVAPWLASQQLVDVEILDSDINTELWLTLAGGELGAIQASFDNSTLRWKQGEEEHAVTLHQGLLRLQPEFMQGKLQQIKVWSDDVRVQTDKLLWPQIDVAAQWQPSGWQVQVNELSLASLRPLLTLLPEDSTLQQSLQALAPKGSVKDLRVASIDGKPRFSASFTNLGIAQWGLLPEVHHLSGRVAGDAHGGKVELALADDTLPYGEVFQAPLMIERSKVTGYWQLDEQGWRLWSDAIALTTPHLQVDGQFRLDFPADAPSWLSFYGEASLNDAGETWRYLPTLALGRKLTDYLSSAIQGGHADSAQLLWYGELSDFPYRQHEGVFQAYVPMEQGTFSFDTSWPALTDLKLDLLFENAMLYLDADHAKTLGATATKVQGSAGLGSDGSLALTIDAMADGPQVRDYMLATPLVDSVGAALTTIQVEGPVTSRFDLDIPFNGTEVTAKGTIQLKENQVTLETPTIELDSVVGELAFDNDVITAKGIEGRLLGQPVTFGFDGSSVQQGYQVGVDIGGTWQLARLNKQLNDPLLKRLDGVSAWQGKVGVNLSDVGVAYDVTVDAGLKQVNSTLPYPLSHPVGLDDSLIVKVEGGSERVKVNVIAPQARYQGLLDITQSPLVIDASQLIVGRGEFRPMFAGDHSVQVDADTLDIDQWLALAKSAPTASTSGTGSKPVAFPQIPMPNRISAKLESLMLGGLGWHDIDLALRHKGASWYSEITSREIAGRASWNKQQPLSIELERLHLNLPKSEQEQEPQAYQPQRQVPAPTELERQLMDVLPEMDVTITDAWLQGYRLGRISGELRRDNQTLELRNFEMQSGSTYLNLDGHWTLGKRASETQIAFDIEGENSSDLMGALGVSGGIQDAEFTTFASIQWQGAPWRLHRETLSGEVRTKVDQGVIGEIGGAGRLLGLFSLDSIVRKLKLDFSGVFEDGLAFNYIKGEGNIDNGLFTIETIEMEALAGDMNVQGTANLITETVDARVQFLPDFTSGIPVLTAFAVAPQVALYVFAISTAISPVLDVFTQINYSIKGPLSSPEVLEQSRLTGEYSLPEKVTEQLKKVTD